MPTPPQYFKGEDATELKFDAAGSPLLNGLLEQKQDFFDEAYLCYVLGEVLWDNNLAPLARAIPREIFRVSYASIFESFRFAGTFDSYIEVFKAIFGDDVEITFTVPAPGKLNIDIVATGVELEFFAARRIESIAYVYDDILTQDDEHILFRSIKGFESEYELNRMLYEMVPDGIFTNISLTLGS